MELSKIKNAIIKLRKLIAILIIWSILNTVIGISTAIISGIAYHKATNPPMVFIGDFGGLEYED